MADKQVTRAVKLVDVADLLDDPPRVHMAYVVDGRVDAGPVTFARAEGRYFVVPPEGVSAGARVSLLIDSGLYNPELRGVRINGAVEDVDPLPASVPMGALELVPSSTTAWDYGAMRSRGHDEA